MRRLAVYATSPRRADVIDIIYSRETNRLAEKLRSIRDRSVALDDDEEFDVERESVDSEHG